MRSRDNEDKHHARSSGGGRQTCNRQRIVSISKEPAIVEQCEGKLKKLSPTSSCSHYSRRSVEKPNSMKGIKTSFYPQRLESTVSTGIATKLATYEDCGKDVHLENIEVSPRIIRCSRSKSEIAGRGCFPGLLDMDEVRSNQDQDLKQTKHVSQRQHVFNKQAIITNPSLRLAAQASVNADMALFNFRKYLKDLVEDQCWLVDKIIQLKRELNDIVKKMEEVKGQGSLKSSTPDFEIVKAAQCSQSGRVSLCSSNNCVPNYKLYLFRGNKSRNLTSPTLKISEASSYVSPHDVPGVDNETDCSRNAALRQHPRQQKMSGALSCPIDISPVIKTASDLCSSREQPAAGVFRFVQYVVLLLLFIFQLIVQLVTMGT